MNLLFALFGCSSGAQLIATLPSTFTPLHVIADSPQIVLGFEGGPFIPLPQRRLAAYEIQGQQLKAIGPTGTGWYQAGYRQGNCLWVIAATARPDGNGSLYQLWSVDPQGWHDQGLLPATSLTDLATEDGQAGWAVGVQQLYRTENAGQSWQKIQGAPAPGNVRESLGIIGPQRLFIGGGALLYTENAGNTWKSWHSEPILATDGHWALAGTTGQKVAKIENDHLTWISEIDAQWYPQRVQNTPQGLRILATKSQSSQLVVLDSKDGGQYFTVRRLTGASDPAWVGLGQEILWMDVRRKLWRLP